MGFRSIPEGSGSILSVHAIAKSRILNIHSRVLFVRWSFGGTSAGSRGCASGCAATSSSRGDPGSGDEGHFVSGVECDFRGAE